MENLAKRIPLKQQC